MKTIVHTLFGSHLYGTNTPASDTDYKSVHLPSAEDLLLIKTTGVISTKTKADSRAKNTADDVDNESFALHRFFDMLEKGESLALEVLFTPESSILLKTPEWDAIQGVRPSLLTKNCRGFVAYCQRQAAKYGVKGSRVATSRAALDQITRWMEAYSGTKRLAFFVDEITAFTARTEHTSVVQVPQANGTTQPHWEICDRKLPYTINLREAHHVISKLFENYGERARLAEQNAGIDWKAMSHAVRVGYQAIELLSTGNLTFPRPEAPYLLEIKRGLLPYKQIEEELEFLLSSVEGAAARSSLPESVDRALMNAILMDLHEDQILNSEPTDIEWWPDDVIRRAAA